MPEFIQTAPIVSSISSSRNSIQSLLLQIHSLLVYYNTRVAKLSSRGVINFGINALCLYIIAQQSLQSISYENDKTQKETTKWRLLRAH